LKIYTRRGDRGETDLFGGPRVGKDDVRVQAYGEVDELNAAVGVAAAASAHDDVRALCAEIQSRLFDLGAYLATPDAQRREKSGVPQIESSDIEHLERELDGFDEELEPLKSFILPGGIEASAAFHVARTVCRRAERRCVTLARDADLDANAIGYLNRLSDLLFTIARVENRRAGVSDVEWAGRR
jgi:cob(I)alamin adenosyltransferase